MDAAEKYGTRFVLNLWGFYFFLTRGETLDGYVPFLPITKNAQQIQLGSRLISILIILKIKLAQRKKLYNEMQACDIFTKSRSRTIAGFHSNSWSYRIVVSALSPD